MNSAEHFLKMCNKVENRTVEDYLKGISYNLKL